MRRRMRNLIGLSLATTFLLGGCVSSQQWFEFVRSTVVLGVATIAGQVAQRGVQASGA